jgi:hypothetical protein
LEERALPQDGRERGGKRGSRAPARSVTVNTLESPLGWLFVRGKVTRRQFDAGELLRGDYERAQLEPSTTMSWDASPAGKGKRGPPRGLDPTTAQLTAKQRFEAAVAEVGPGLDDILWRIVCAGEGMRDAERALGWPARAGKLVLGLALDRLADFYRLN